MVVELPVQSVLITTKVMSSNPIHNRKLWLKSEGGIITSSRITYELWNVNSTPGIYVDIAVINYAQFMKCTKQKNVAASKIGLQFLYKKKLNKKYVNQWKQID
jgi:hypothetical protein